MMRYLLIAVLLLAGLTAYAPGKHELFVPRAEKIKPYERLMWATGMVESHNDSLAYNPVEHAVGIFQIRPIRLRDYNQRTHKSYKLKDCYKTKVSKEIFLYYCQGHDLETISRAWNGSGAKTKEYFNKVKKHL
jgi:hypothetical protein